MPTCFFVFSPKLRLQLNPTRDKIEEKGGNEMKKIKKLLAPVLAVIMLVLMLVPALAAGEDPVPAKPFENSEFFTYNELTVHYRVFKAENEKAKIFMIHGFAMSSCCWEELATRLCAEGYTCVAADLPDFGYSSRENGSSTLYPREDVMHALMTELDANGKWYVAGHSMGGYIALALAAKYPESVKNLMLFGTACNTEKPQWLNSMMTNKLFVSVMGPLMELMGRIEPLVKMILSAALCDNDYLKNYDISKLTAPFKIKGSGAGALYSFSALPVTDLTAVEKMPPVLYMNGDRDAAIPESDRELLRQHLPNGSTDITVKGGGHLFIENRADEVFDDVVSFINNNI